MKGNYLCQSCYDQLPTDLKILMSGVYTGFNIPGMFTEVVSVDYENCLWCNGLIELFELRSSMGPLPIITSSEKVYKIHSEIKFYVKKHIRSNKLKSIL